MIGTGDERAEVELPRPDPPAVRCANQDVAINVSDKDFVAVVAPLEVADGDSSVVDQFHDGTSTVVAPNYHSPRRITCGYLIKVLIPAYYSHL